MGFGIAMTRLWKLPQWVTPAMCFNNTTSLPLLLIQSLESTGILERLIVTDEKTSQAVQRAKSYFLVNAIVGNCLTFAIGPRLIDAEHAADRSQDQKRSDDEDQGDDTNADEEQANGPAEEQTSLLPNSIQQAENAAVSMGQRHVKKHWHRYSARTQAVLAFCYDFFNAPLIGAVIGSVIGLTPPLHRIFFNDPQSGGVLKAWFTTSLSNIGGLFASLQIVVVGFSLSSSLRKLKRGEDSGKLPWLSSVLVLAMRFILWPVLSIAVIWAFATRTSLLGDDPILWFAMMLMPCGPPAMKLVAMADVNGAAEPEKMKIAKFLTVSSPYKDTIRMADNVPRFHSPHHESNVSADLLCAITHPGLQRCWRTESQRACHQFVDLTRNVDVNCSKSSPKPSCPAVQRSVISRCHNGVLPRLSSARRSTSR